MSLPARQVQGNPRHPLAPDVDDPSSEADADGLQKLVRLRHHRERLLRQLTAVDLQTRRQLHRLDGRVTAGELSVASGMSEGTVAELLAEHRTPPGLTAAAR